MAFPSVPARSFILKSCFGRWLGDLEKVCVWGGGRTNRKVPCPVEERERTISRFQVTFEFCLRHESYLGLAHSATRASATRLAIHNFPVPAPKTVVNWIWRKIHSAAVGWVGENLCITLKARSWLKAAWDEIPIEQVTNLVDSMPRRIRAVIQCWQKKRGHPISGGGQTRY